MGLIHAAFHEPQTRIHRIVQTIVWGLIFLSAVTLAIELTTDAEMPRPRVGSFRPPELTHFDRSLVGRLTTHVLGPQ